MSVKIRLKRLGKIRSPHYRIVVADSRTKRDGRAIEEIGTYNPMREPSLMQVDSERAQYWLSVGAQPTEQVRAILTVTGDWQKFTGQPGAEGTLRVPEGRVEDRSGFSDAKALSENEAKTLKTRKKAEPAPAPAATSAEEPTEVSGEKPAEAPGEKPVEDAPVAAPEA